ncbi:MAG: hypothetical protein DRO06_05060 [Thermoproteota archaeon]|nr:MAG: hypothetical protein DRO06_05060 [Candidatus Korarchaeota archaeon]
MAEGLPEPVWEEVLDSMRRVAACYERANAVMSLGLSSRMRRALLEMVPIPPNARILDAGCGPGEMSVEVARLLSPSSTLYLLDPLREMVELARSRVAGLVRVVPLVGTFEDIPLDDGSVDVVLASYSLRDARDRRRALSEFRRVLRVGGILGVVEVTRPDGRAASAVAALYVRLVAPGLAVLATGRVDCPWRCLYKTFRGMWTSSELVDEISRLFRVIEVRKRALGVFTAVAAIKV